VTEPLVRLDGGAAADRELQVGSDASYEDEATA